MGAKKNILRSVDQLLLDVGMLEAKVRDALQYDSVSRRLRKNGSFNQVCALLDFIGDSDSAILSVSSGQKRKKLNLYFLTYGLLETMQSREVALRTLLKTMKVKAPLELSNTGVGGPRAKVSSHFLTSGGAPNVIVRNSMTEDQFEYWTYYSDRTGRGNIVIYDALLRSHLMAVIAALRRLHSDMIKVENKRRARMSKMPLTPLLDSIRYPVSRLVAATVDEKYVPIISAHADLVEGVLKKFKADLAKRMGDEPANHHVDHVIEGLDLLRSLSGLVSRQEVLRFRLVAEGVEGNISALRRLAVEIDGTEAERIRT